MLNPHLTKKSRLRDAARKKKIQKKKRRNFPRGGKKKEERLIRLSKVRGSGNLGEGPGVGRARGTLPPSLRVEKALFLAGLSSGGGKGWGNNNLSTHSTRSILMRRRKRGNSGQLFNIITNSAERRSLALYVMPDNKFFVCYSGGGEKGRSQVRVESLYQKRREGEGALLPLVRAKATNTLFRIKSQRSKRSLGLQSAGSLSTQKKREGGEGGCAFA